MSGPPLILACFHMHSAHGSRRRSVIAILHAHALCVCVCVTGPNWGLDTGPPQGHAALKPVAELLREQNKRLAVVATHNAAIARFCSRESWKHPPRHLACNSKADGPSVCHTTSIVRIDRVLLSYVCELSVCVPCSMASLPRTAKHTS